MTYAEDVNYWQTSRTSPDSWLDSAKLEIKAAGGKVAGEGFINEVSTGRASFLLAFELQGEQFKMVWPVLQSKTKNEKAAQIQAATALYHEVKAACVKVKFVGARVAFFSWLMLPDGRTVSEAGGPELVEALPGLLGGRLIGPGDSRGG